MDGRGRYRELRKAIAPQVAAQLKRQMGVISFEQAIDLGMSKRAIDGHVARGEWETVFPRIYRAATVPVFYEQELMAGYLWMRPPGAISHRAAAAVRAFPGFEQRVIELTTLNWRASPNQRVVLHCSGDLERYDVETLGPLPVTNATRTLIDLGAVAGRRLLADALDDALRRRLTSLPQLQWRLDQVAKRGRRGVAPLRALLAERDPREVIPASVLETRFVALLRKARLPQPDRQYKVMDEARHVARVDFFYDEAKLVVEVDGYKWHSSPAAFQRDRERRNALELRGHRVLSYTWYDVTKNVPRVVQEVRWGLGLAPLRAS